MAKAGDKSSTSDQIGTEKFKPKTRSTDDPQVKHAQRKAVCNAVNLKAGHRAPRMMSISLPEKTEWRALLDREREQRQRLHETLPAGGKQHQLAIRGWWGAVSKVLGGIKNVTNLDDFDLDDLPYELFAMLAGQAAYLAVGQIPDPIKHVGGKGRTAAGPGETSDIRWAVTYVRAVRDGLVRGRKPVAVVRRLYKLRDDRIVRTWCQKYKPFSYPDEWVVSSLRNRVADAARRYRQANARSWAAPFDRK